jgi:hypothetical protein
MRNSLLSPLGYFWAAFPHGLDQVDTLKYIIFILPSPILQLVATQMHLPLLTLCPFLWTPVPVNSATLWDPDPQIPFVHPFYTLIYCYLVLREQLNARNPLSGALALLFAATLVPLS